MNISALRMEGCCDIHGRGHAQQSHRGYLCAVRCSQFWLAQGFDPSEVSSNYGDSLTVWDWTKKKPVQTLHLGAEGLIPLELRFLHEPSQPHAYVGAALSSNVIHITKVRSLVLSGHSWSVFSNLQ